MNQMEAFKWEQKRQAASAKDKDKEKHTKDKEAEERRLRDKAAADERAKAAVRQEDEKREKELDELENLVLQQAKLAGQSSLEMTSLPRDVPTIEVVATPVSLSSSSNSPTSTYSVSGSSSSEEMTNNATAQGPLSEPVNSSSTAITSQTSSSSVSSKIPSTRSDSSESIYAQIVRRLNALEGNSSLVARYIEEQAKVMRVMLTRVERGWEEYRVDRENEEHRRWEQEVSWSSLALVYREIGS